MDHHNDTRHILIYLASLATLLTHYVVDHYRYTRMSKPPNKKASWNTKEVKELINYLYSHHTEAGDGSNFKATTFNAAAKHLTHSFRQQGQ